jgi:hypothetical protein
MPAVNVRPRHRNAPEPEAKRISAYLQWLRGRPCFVGGTCAGRIEACHVGPTGKGTGTKCVDSEALPMCSHHHAEQHMAGIRTFETRHSVNLLAAAERYFQLWPGRVSWERRNG